MRSSFVDVLEVAFRNERLGVGEERGVTSHFPIDVGCDE